MGFVRNFLRDRAAARPPSLPDGNDLATPELVAEKFATISSYYDFCETGAMPRFPLEIFVEISNLCDLKCAMCATFSALSSKRLEF